MRLICRTTSGVALLLGAYAGAALTLAVLTSILNIASTPQPEVCSTKEKRRLTSADLCGIIQTLGKQSGSKPADIRNTNPR